MATNCGRLPTTRRVAALFLAVGILCPLPAVAEIPRTTAEWLAVYKERQARFDAVEIESHWQRLEGEKVVEEWDQIFYADDLGRLRLQEFGRLEKHPTRDNVGLLVDKFFAYDGTEYREFEQGWEFSLRLGLTDDAKRLAKATSSRLRQGRIEGQIDEHSRIRKSETPMGMADYWFLTCLMNAAKEGVEPNNSAVSGTHGQWEVILGSSRPEWGRGCRAIIDENQGSRVTHIELRSGDQWIGYLDASYANYGAHWLPARIRFVQSGSAPELAHGRELRCHVTRAVVVDRRNDEDFLPEFTPGTIVTDARTDASFKVGEDNHDEAQMARLVTQAREDFAVLGQADKEFSRWHRQALLFVQYAAGGLVASLLLQGLWSKALRGRSRRNGD